MSEIALAWEWAKGINAPIVGSTKIKHLESAVNSMDVELTLDEVNYFDELYVPHPIIGAINQNPPEGTVVLDRKWSKVLFDQDQLNKRMDEMAARLNKKYEGQEPIVIPVLNGAMIFASDMIKRLTFELTIEPMKASSYEGTSSTGKVKITQDVKSDVKNRPVIFMEDIIDTGRTLKALSDLMKERGAKSVEVISMLDKPETRVVDFYPDDYGFKAPNEFLVGYGLDYNGLYRNLPYVGILKQRVYA